VHFRVKVELAGSWLYPRPTPPGPASVARAAALVVGITRKEALRESLRAVAVIPEDELRALVKRAREQRGVVEIADVQPLRAFGISSSRH
jgi:hypothetical protein